MKKLAAFAMNADSAKRIKGGGNNDYTPADGIKSPEDIVMEKTPEDIVMMDKASNDTPWYNKIG